MNSLVPVATTPGVSERAMIRSETPEADAVLRVPALFCRIMTFLAYSRDATNAGTASRTRGRFDVIAMRGVCRFTRDWASPVLHDMMFPLCPHLPRGASFSDPALRAAVKKEFVAARRKGDDRFKDMFMFFIVKTEPTEGDGYRIVGRLSRDEQAALIDAHHGLDPELSGISVIINSSGMDRGGVASAQAREIGRIYRRFKDEIL